MHGRSVEYHSLYLLDEFSFGELAYDCVFDVLSRGLVEMDTSKVMGAAVTCGSPIIKW